MWNYFPSCRPSYVFKCLFLLSAMQISCGQYFDPDLDDKTYLDNLQNKIETEVKATRDELIVQAQIVELMTKQFVAAQLKENLFIALRVLAEKELSQLDHEKTNANLLLAMANKDLETTEVSLITNGTTVSSSSQLIPRQDDDDDDDNGGAAGVGGATTVRVSDTAQFQQGLIPQVANLIKAIFGGNQNINLTNYVTGATKLLPKPVGSQVVGLVSSLSVPSNQNQAGGASKVPPPYRSPGQQYAPGYNPNVNQIPGTAGYRPNQVPGSPGFRPNNAAPGAPGYRPNNVAPGTPGFRPNQIPGQGVPGYRPNQVPGGNYPVNQGVQQTQGQVGSGSYRPNGNPAVGAGARPNPVQGGGVRPNQAPVSSQLSEYKPNQIPAANNNGRPNSAAVTRPYQINQQNKVPVTGNGVPNNNAQNFQQQPQFQPGQIGNANRLPPSNANVNNQNPGTDSFSNTFNSVPQLGTVRTTTKPYIYNPNANKVSSRPGFQASVPQYQINQQYQQQQQIQQQQQFQQTQFQQAFPPQQQYQQPQNQFVPQQQFPQQFPPQQQQQQQQQQQPQQPIRQQPGVPFEGNRPNPNGVQRPTEEDEDEDEDEDGRKRQFNIGSILAILKPTQAAKVVPQPQYVNAAASPGCANIVPTTYAATSTGTVSGNVLQQQQVQVGVGQVQIVPIQAGQTQVNSQIIPTQTGVATGSQTPGTCLADPSDVSSIMMAQGFNLGTFANDVGKSFRDIIRVMPDIFRGAREGVQLLQTLSSVLGGLDGFSLGDIF